MTRLGVVNSNTGHGIAKVGTAVLSGGTVTVSETSITANTIIMLTVQNGVLNIGHVWVSARIVGTSFTISSVNVLDARTVAYLLIEP